MRRLAVVAALALVVAVPVAAAETFTARETLLPGCGGSNVAKYKPSSVIVTCGDGGFRVSHMRWSTWTNKSAAGRGTAKVNNCDPSCAEGEFESYRVKLSPYRPKNCPGGKREFARLTYTFPGDKPDGAKRSGTLRRGCSR